MSGRIVSNGLIATFENSKQLAFGGIGAAYAEIGELDYPSKQFIVSNFTDVTLWISVDGVNDSLPLAAGSVFVSDVLADGSFISAGTKFYAKEFTVAPAVGSIVLSSMYELKI